jgi:serine/threonine protein kinase
MRGGAREVHPGAARTTADVVVSAPARLGHSHPMPSHRPSGEDGEEERAFFQARVALFWKVVFFIVLLGSGLGAIGAVKKPGPDLLLTLASATQAGVFWWLCRRGVRSIRFSRAMESGGLLLNSAIGALLGRYLLAGFAHDHSVIGAQGAVLADAYVSLLQLAGMAMMVAIRAALIPSLPGQTIVVTALFGAPMIVVNAVLVPAPDGGFALRGLDSGALPWMPAIMAMMWGFAIITCAAISWVVYGLRSEVREARRLGQYVLEQKLGEGGMGEVYRARHGMMRRPSAIKLLRVDRAGELNLRRFEREVQLTARLTHPNTITIFDYGRTHDGVFYYAMELLDGATLQRIVAVDGAQTAGRVVRILGMVCGALTEAHGIGLIHRDIKPANIMLCTQGGERDVVKLLDFGLVKEFEVKRDVELTAASNILGTPQYMAPESILQPDSADVRTDIYALGAVAYYLLAGVDVFDGKSIVEVCAQHLHEEPKPMSSRGIAVPAGLEEVVLACLQKEPDRRPQSAADLRRRLEACAVDPWDSISARAWWVQHQPELEAEPVLHGTSPPRTIAVDGSLRSAKDLAAPVS